MAYLLRRCKSCGDVYDVLTTVRHSLDCPSCGGEGENIPQRFADRVYTEVMSSEDEVLIHQSHMRRKKQLDERADEIRDGSLDLKLQGPERYWPDAAKEKRLY